MAHSRVDGQGIPDEQDAQGQDVWACGTGITDPGCRITPGKDGTYAIEATTAVSSEYPYRVLYVQWPPSDAGEEKWISWQLPTG